MPFSTLIGHAPIVELLRRAAERDRVPQSLIFAGPEGVGKRTAAIALAQALNCPKRANGDGCGTCPACLRIARGQHADVTMLEKGDEASIKIKPLRERILDHMGYRPFEGRHRMAIIDPADELTWEAQDALLKTLEEPPSSAVLILVTAYPDTLLATIRSRCRRLRFGPLAEGDVARVLVDRAGVDRAAARGLAAASGGSVARALASRAGEFEEDRDAALDLVAAARSGGVAGRLNAAAAFAKHGSKRRDREAVAARLVLVASLLRDLGALHARSETPLANADLEDRLRELSGAFDLSRATAGFAAVDRAAAALERNASPKIVSDWIAVRL